MTVYIQIYMYPFSQACLCTRMECTVSITTSIITTLLIMSSVYQSITFLIKSETLFYYTVIWKDLKTK